LSFSDIVI